MQPIDIHTPRLWIRPLRLEDVEPLAKLWTDPQVTQYMGGPRDYDRLVNNLAADAAAEPPRYDLWPVIERASGRLVGHCGILDKEVDGVMEYELVYVLAPAVWGLGYAGEAAAALRDDAFDRLGLDRIISLIEPEHEASRRVAERAGLRLEKETVRSGGRRMLVFALDRTQRPGGLAELNTARLRLVALSAEQLQQLTRSPRMLEDHLGLSVLPDVVSEAVRGAVSVKLEKMARVSPTDHPWFTYWLMVVKAERQGIGLAGFKGSPSPTGEIEIGYGTALSARGRGYTTEAVLALLDWAFSFPQCTAVIAETHQDNLASQRVLKKAGFTVFRRSTINLFWRYSRQ